MLQQRGWTYGGGGGGWIACFPPWLSHSVSRTLGVRGGGQTEESAGDLKPDLPPHLLPRSLLLLLLHRDSLSNVIPSRGDWKHTPRQGKVEEEGGKGGMVKKKWGMEIVQRERDPRAEKHSQKTES